MMARKSKSQREVEAWLAEANRQWRDEWRAETGRSIADWNAGMKDSKSDVWEWRRAQGRAAVEAEKAAWLADHPGNPLPEHLCSLTAEEAAEYDRWRAKRDGS